MERAANSATDLFNNSFYGSAEMVAVAPGRVNLIGEHIDYNDGIVLPFAIDRYTSAAAAHNTDGVIRLKSDQFNTTTEIQLDSPLQPSLDCWTNYVTGVVAEFQKRNIEVQGFDAAICSNVPLGSGLSSSAALEVAAATMLEALTKSQLSKTEKGLICQAAEHNFAGVPCGIMDQFASVFGQENNLIKIDCMDQSVELIPTVGMEQFSFLVTNTLAKHSLVDGEYAARKQQSESALAKTGKTTYRDVSLADLEKAGLTDVEIKRSRHVVTEIDRTIKTAQSIAAGDWTEVGELMHASHYSLKENYAVSCEELDFLVEQCQQIGVSGGIIGSRMTGGGFGGCTITLVYSDKLQKIIETLQNNFAKRFGRIPPAFATKPSAGAQLI